MTTKKKVITRSVLLHTLDRSSPSPQSCHSWQKSLDDLRRFYRFTAAYQLLISTKTSFAWCRKPWTWSVLFVMRVQKWILHHETQSPFLLRQAAIWETFFNVNYVKRYDPERDRIKNVPAPGRCIKRHHRTKSTTARWLLENVRRTGSSRRGTVVAKERIWSARNI